MNTTNIIARAQIQPLQSLSSLGRPSRYIVEEKKNGFVVRGRPHHWDVPGAPEWLIELCYDGGRERREPVTVTLEPYFFEVASPTGRIDDFDPFGAPGEQSTRYGLFDFPQMITDIAKRLMVPWRRPVRDYVGPDEEQEAGSWLVPWVIKQTEKAIAKQVRTEWQRLLEPFDPTILAVQKKVFAATWNCRRAPLLSDDALYREKYIVKDILSYRAAAVAVLACGFFGPANESSIEKMRHWRDLFAPAGMGAYTSLNKTLMNLPGGVPASLLGDLRQVVLPRPIYNRLELIATILAGARTTDNFHVFAHATADEIKEAVRRMSVSLQRQQEAEIAEMIQQFPGNGWERAKVRAALSPRRTRDIREAVYYMLDFPDDHNGRLVGLAEKAIRWHGTAGREEEARKTIRRFGTERKTALPPIGLPKVEGIRLLATVGDIVTEAEKMRHCIASYADKAVEGHCFLFHVDYRGESASVEVDHMGQIKQARGPRNSPNVATHWGAKVLAEWGCGFSDGDAAGAFSRAAADTEALNQLCGAMDIQPAAGMPVIVNRPEDISDDDFLRELMAL